MKSNKINLKQPKYVLPLLVLPFILIISFLGRDYFKSNEIEQQLVEVETLNTELPEANLEKRRVHNKFEALKEAIKKSSDYSSIQTIQDDDFDELEDKGSLYSEEEIKEIDSLQNRTASLTNEEILKKLQELEYEIEEEPPFNEQIQKNEREREVEEEMELFKQQMRYIDSLQNPENYIVKEIHQDAVNLINEVEEQFSSVTKKSNKNSNYFNTISSSSSANNNNLITAILDETLTVTQGSRVRIRLLDDIMIDSIPLKKGSYLYGNVRAFKAQRVLLDISSILVNGHQYNVSLAVFDNDGQEGFYIPHSSFRDLTKDIGASAQSQSINLNSNDGGVEQFAYNALQDVYKSTTQAFSKKIKQNKAVLKYNTHVFLVNKKNK